MGRDELPKKGGVLVLGKEAHVLAAPLEKLTPEIGIRFAANFADAQPFLTAELVDVVILSQEVLEGGGLELIHSLRLSEANPAIVFVARDPSPHLLMSVIDGGCQKIIFEQEGWGSQLVNGVRHLLRIRRLEEENQVLLAKLTQANVLLEEKNKRLDEFSATVAHDIRGPLGGISMKLEYMLESKETQLDKKFTGLLERALTSVQRLTDLVQAMYDFAKLGSKAAKMGEVDIQRLVDEVITDMPFDESLDVQITLGELPTVWGNSELLRRVFINLIGNAVKYNDKKQIEICIGSKGRTLQSFGEAALIEIKDNGPGIESDDIPEIFGIFRRGSSSTKSEGLGVGLAVVQRIVELHYGRIDVESQVGRGTSFLLTLPIEKLSVLSQPRAQEAEFPV